jgi:signal transduction histidine kinase
VRPKIICRCEARLPASGDNGVVDHAPVEQLLGVTLRRLSSSESEYAAVALLTLLAVYEASRFQTYGGPLDKGRAIVLGVLTLVPILVSRSSPAVAAAAATLLTVTVLRTENPALTVVSVCIALFLVAHLVLHRGLTLAALLLVPFFVIAVVRLSGPQNALGSTAPLLFCLAALAVGESLRRRRLAVAALDATEEAMAASTHAQAVMEERARIARELHDVVAHHLSVIVVESEAARLTSPELPSQTGDRLRSIAATAREALTETRRLLGVVREDTGGEPDRMPQPGLGQLDDLIAQAEATGTHIRFIRVGKVAPLPLGADLAAYRIIQEALTNARRHAPGADVEVELSYDDHALHIRVRDHGPGPLGGEPVEGHGLLGMRERATLAGGTFSVGKAEGGGLEVNVMLPTTEATP